MIEWQESLSVGVPVIDDDHKALIALLNQYLEAIESKKLLEILSIFRALEKYTHEHFAREEDLMAQCGYPKLKEHIKGHEAMCDTLHDFIDEILFGADAEKEAEIKDFLITWLPKHIMGEDFQYRESMKKLKLSRG